MWGAHGTIGSCGATLIGRGIHAAASASVASAVAARNSQRARATVRSGAERVELPLGDPVIWLARQRALEGVSRTVLITQLN